MTRHINLNTAVVESAIVGNQTIPVLVPELPSTDELIPFLRKIDANHWYSNYGPLWREFRESLKACLVSRTQQPSLDIAFTSSGTTAIELALRVRALAGRRLCLVPSFTFVASAHAICNAGLEPFLLDVDELSLTLTPEIAAKALPHLPEAPAAVLVVSAFGAPLDILGWEAFEQTYGIPVVFDAAAAMMSLEALGRQPLCVSLHATKVFGIGEGGAVLSTDPQLINQITAMTGFGFTNESRASSMRGGNYRISEYAAAVGLASLATIERKIMRLRSVVTRYAGALGGSRFKLQDDVGDRWVTMTLNIIVPVESVDDTLGNLTRAKVEWRHWWGLGCHTHPAFAKLGSLDLSVTKALAPRVVGIPCYSGLTADAIDKVSQILLSSIV